MRSVRERLKNLGSEVSSCVLDCLSRTVRSCVGIAESIIRDIDCDDSISDGMQSGIFIFGESGPVSERLHPGEEQHFHATRHFSDIYILIEMLSMPSLVTQVAQTFEKAVVRGTFVPQSVAMVLERRLARRLDLTSQYIAENFQQPVVTDEEAIEQLRAQADDFASVLFLADKLALSKDPRVKEFVKILYTVLFKWYADESHRLRMLKRLVDCATSTTDASLEIDLYLEVLAILLSEDQELVRPVLNMMREVVDLTHLDRSTLWHQLRASGEEVRRIRDEREAEVATAAKEKAALSQRLAECEASNSRLKVKK